MYEMATILQSAGMFRRWNLNQESGGKVCVTGTLTLDEAAVFISLMPRVQFYDPFVATKL